MPVRAFKPCSHPVCSELTHGGYCPAHKRKMERQRGSAHQRGYSSRWAKYSRWFLRQPDNVFCKLQLPGCTNLAICTDHIDPPSGPEVLGCGQPSGCMHPLKQCEG